MASTAFFPFPASPSITPPCSPCARPPPRPGVSSGARFLPCTRFSPSPAARAPLSPLHRLPRVSDATLSDNHLPRSFLTPCPLPFALPLTSDVCCGRWLVCGHQRRDLRRQQRAQGRPREVNLQHPSCPFSRFSCRLCPSRSAAPTYIRLGQKKLGVVAGSAVKKKAVAKGGRMWAGKKTQANVAPRLATGWS